MNDTPRTDLKAEPTTDFRGISEVVPASFARQLERELNEANRKWKSEVGYLRAQLDLHKDVRMERDQWRKCAEELAQTIEHALAHFHKLKDK